LDGEGYGNVGPIGLGNGAFDNYVIYFFVVVSVLSVGVKVSIGTSDDCEDCAMSGEGLSFLLRLLDLWWRWRRWVGFDLDPRVGVV
jgi:hypothetical protein